MPAIPACRGTYSASCATSPAVVGVACARADNIRLVCGRVIGLEVGWLRDARMKGEVA